MFFGGRDWRVGDITRAFGTARFADLLRRLVLFCVQMVMVVVLRGFEKKLTNEP